MQNLNAGGLLRLRGPILGPLETDRWLSKDRNYFLICHARLNRQQILMTQQSLALACDARASGLLVRSGYGECDEKHNPTLREERLLHFQPNDRLDLFPPDSLHHRLHRTASSFPIKYS